ncbi:MAG: sigma-70 family RNA polymerase sigma factor [Vulcanimicrobiota bacterium]
MKKCYEIYKCTAVEYLTCSAKMSMTNCWLLKKGCQCRKDTSLTCNRCFIYLEHQEQIKDLVQKSQESDEKAIEELIDEYSRFVYQIGKRFFLPGATKEDLIQEGMIGLFKAILSYDSKYKTSFDDYASLSIRNRILRAVRMATQLKQKVLSDAFSMDEDPYYYASLFAETNVEQRVVGKISMKELTRSFEKILSPMEYQIITMKIFDASVDEMAGRFNLSKKQVENALFRARKKISSFLRENVGSGEIDFEDNQEM